MTPMLKIQCNGFLIFPLLFLIINKADDACMHYSISQKAPQLAEVPQLTEGMKSQGRRQCRAIVLIE
jgi:hypothetical protein